MVEEFGVETEFEERGRKFGVRDRLGTLLGLGLKQKRRKFLKLEKYLEIFS